MTAPSDFDALLAGAKSLQTEPDWEAWFACAAEHETSGESLETLLAGVSEDNRHPNLWADARPVGRETW